MKSLENGRAQARAFAGEVWVAVLAMAHEHWSGDEIAGWLKPLSIGAADDAEVVLLARTGYARDRVRADYLEKLQELWSRHDARARALRVCVQPRDAGPEPQESCAVFDAAVAQDADATLPGLDARFTFDRFVKGKANEVACTVAARMAGARPPFRLVLIHGRTGVGKTHLLQAAAREAAGRGKRVLYLTAEAFLTDFLTSLRDKTITQFKEQVRGVDLLLVDDIRFIAGKAATCDQFALTINAVISGGGAVMCSADGPAETLEGFDERLRCQLKGGVSCRIEEPDFAMRRAIASRFATDYAEADPSFSLSAEVLDLVATRLAGPGRTVEGCINKIYAGSALLGRPVTPALVEEAIMDVRRTAETKRITLDMIQKKASVYFDVTLSDLNSPCRKRAIVRPRQIAMYLCNKMTARSVSEIGRKFGGRDHTTVLNAIRRIEMLMEEDERVAKDVEGLRSTLLQ
jgi:chromosomal replication initiator protein